MNSHGKTAAVTATAAPVVKIMTSTKAIHNEAERLKTAGATYQHDLHSLACSVLAHVGKHGQINVLTHFLATIPDAVRVNSLQTWFETFGNVTFSALDNADSKKATWRVDNKKKPRLGDAMVKPFWKFKANEGEAYKPLDMSKFVQQTISKFEKDKAELLKLDQNADVSQHNAMIMALKTTGADKFVH